MNEQIASGEVDGWRDIATVPQDGSTVLLWLREPYARVEIARWDWRLDCFVTPDEMGEIGSKVPTHWRPLPDPPTPRSKSDAP